MLEKISTAVIFYAHYIDTKVGATGLTVTVDVWEIARDGTATEIVTGGSATEIGDGLYRYLLAAGSVDTAAEYVAVFKTANTDVDQRDIPAIWVIQRAGIENLDAAISSRSTLTAEQVNAEADTALTDYDPPTKAELDARTLVAASYATAANQTTVLARIGAFTGTGLNTILGFLRALAAKAAALTPSDLASGTNYSNVTDSLEAIRDKLATASITVTSAVTELGNVTVWYGYDYHTDDDLAPEWTDDDGAWPDLTDATVTLLVNDQELSASVSSPADTATVAVNVSSAATVAIGKGDFLFVLKAVMASGRTIALGTGAFSVSDAPT